MGPHSPKHRHPSCLHRSQDHPILSRPASSPACSAFFGYHYFLFTTKDIQASPHATKLRIFLAALHQDFPKRTKTLVSHLLCMPLRRATLFFRGGVCLGSRRQHCQLITASRTGHRYCCILLSLILRCTARRFHVSPPGGLQQHTNQIANLLSQTWHQSPCNFRL